MDAFMCSADFNVIFNGMKCKVYAIKNTMHHGEYNRRNTIEFLLYLHDEWVWIYANQFKPFSEEETNE